MKPVIKNNLTQGQGLSATQKLSLVVGSASVLYLLPTEADAAIINVVPVTPPSVNQSQSLGTEALWDVDGINGADFRLDRDTAFGFPFIDFESNGLNGQGLVQSTGAPGPQVNKLSLGNLVGSTLSAGYQFGPSGLANRTVLKNSSINDNFANGGFDGNPPEYFGFRFLSGGDTFYGWANINIDTATDGGTVTITEWAYQSCADESINVGQTSGPGTCDTSESVPEPSSSLALLAFGAAGVYRWRKNRKSKTVQEKQAA